MTRGSRPGLVQTPEPIPVVGNLPYYITQPVIRRLLEADPAPERIVVLEGRLSLKQGDTVALVGFGTDLRPRGTGLSGLAGAFVPHLERSVTFGNLAFLAFLTFTCADF